MSDTVKNFFEDLVNGTNPKYCGTPEINTPTPSYLGWYHMEQAAKQAEYYASIKPPELKAYSADDLLKKP